MIYLVIQLNAEEPKTRGFRQNKLNESKQYFIVALEFSQLFEPSSENKLRCFKKVKKIEILLNNRKIELRCKAP